MIFLFASLVQNSDGPEYDLKEWDETEAETQAEISPQVGDEVGDGLLLSSLKLWKMFVSKSTKKFTLYFNLNKLLDF